ncbi:hypothetical protein BU16DRAFT_544959 [Lophium mytilinum]|uniref:Uncharacterized protein n=1 Tax=Lophium mytilinum TaxID=390894 RepID=A0A6A6Q9N5_9PEZI|nr:hypothetical protein BU16DRAFT_544959 [Lophium mytilinum]
MPRTSWEACHHSLSRNGRKRNICWLLSSGSDGAACACTRDHDPGAGDESPVSEVRGNFEAYHRAPLLEKRKNFRKLDTQGLLVGGQDNTEQRNIAHENSQNANRSTTVPPPR